MMNFNPQPGFPIEGRSALTTSGACPGAEVVSATEKTFYLFDFNPYMFTPDGTAQTGEIDNNIVIRVRNRFSDAMTKGAELTIMLDADGIGSILVWEC